MAATRTAMKATVTTPDEAFGPVRLRVWGNTATIRDQQTGATITLKDQVVSVGPGRKDGKLTRFTVTFQDGTEWQVAEPRRGCGCGK